MKLTYAGKFSGDVNDLPKAPPHANAVQFREFDDPKKLAVFANGVCILVLLVLFAGIFLRAGLRGLSLPGCILPMLTLFPHELLHAVCFRDRVWLYTNWQQGMLFVVGPEEMSRARFVFMSLLPNLVFGAVPYVLFLIHPAWTVLGTMGAVCLSMGTGDYYNVFNALTQMPKGAKTYLDGFHSWWFLPETEEKG